MGGCGGGSGDAAVELPPAERACVERFNGDPNALEQGKHFYDEHGSRKAMVIRTEPGKGIGAPRRGEVCAIIFAAFEGDEEYGTIGVTELDFGWATMSELARGRPNLDLLGLQRRASSESNASVFPDGKIGG